MSIERQRRPQAMHSIASTVSAVQPKSQGHIKYRRDIDGLRAVAVLCVLMFHAFPNYMKGGFVGVDIFFVISGFLITKVIATTLDNGDFSVTDFYARRVRRILPALAVMLLACMMFGWTTMLAEDFAQLAKHIFGGATFSSNLLLWREAGYFDAASETKPLLHLWSLGIEEQFYIVWPLLMCWGWRNGVPPRTLILVTGLASFLINVSGIARFPTATFYSPASRAWELLLGAGLAYSASAAERGIRPVARHGAAVLGMALILVSAFCLKAGAGFPGWWALPPAAGAALGRASLDPFLRVPDLSDASCDLLCLRQAGPYACTLAAVCHMDGMSRIEGVLLAGDDPSPIHLFFAVASARQHHPGHGASAGGSSTQEWCGLGRFCARGGLGCVLRHTECECRRRFQHILYPAAALLCGSLLWLALRSNWVREWLGCDAMVYLGKRTFGIYVFHVAILTMVVDHVAPRILQLTGSQAMCFVASMVMTAAASIGVAILSYQYLERPFLLLKDKRAVVLTRPV